MTRGRRIAAGAGALVVVVVAAGAFVLWPRGTTEITEKEAVEAFRDRGHPSTDDAARDGADAGRATPRPGVYTYAATGREVVKLGPLPAETRPFPSTITASAVDAGSGCFDWTVNLFAEHTEETRWCTAPALRLASHTKHQRIGALSPTASMTCDPAALPEVDAAAGTLTHLSCTLELSGGPASISAMLDGTATAHPMATISVGGHDVATTPIDVHYSVHGDLSGTWDETTWWSREHLPIRIERSLSLSGPASFTETSELRLTSLDPSS